MNWKTAILAVLLLVCIAAPAWQRRDPLNDEEVQELRDTAQNPPERMKLYLKFAKARVFTLEQLRTDPRLAGMNNGRQIHDLIQDITTIVDEMNDNIDQYADEKWDIRKELKSTVEAATDFQLKFRELKQYSDSPEGSKQANTYKFVLDDAVESVNSCLDNARKTLQEQEADKKVLKKPTT
jgi:regulator of replication initiation timing